LDKDPPWLAPDGGSGAGTPIQSKLNKRAQDDQDGRFTDLHSRVCDLVTLQVAWRRVRANRGVALSWRGGRYGLLRRAHRVEFGAIPPGFGPPGLN